MLGQDLEMCVNGKNGKNNKACVFNFIKHYIEINESQGEINILPLLHK
jgi:hypothetical protein